MGHHYEIQKESHPDFQWPRRKPACLVEIDWHNPIMQQWGDVFASILIATPAGFLNLLDGVTYAVTGSGGYDGVGWANSSSSRLTCVLPDILPTESDAITWGLFGKFKSLSSTFTDLAGFGSGGTLDVGVVSGVVATLISRYIVIPGGQSVSNAFSGAASGNLFSFIGCQFESDQRAGTAYIATVHGTKILITHSETSTNTLFVESDEIYIGESGQSATARLDFAFQLKDALPLFVAEQLSIDPYQILRPADTLSTFLPTQAVLNQNRVSSMHFLKMHQPTPMAYS